MHMHGASAHVHVGVVLSGVGTLQSRRDEDREGLDRSDGGGVESEVRGGDGDESECQESPLRSNAKK